MHSVFLLVALVITVIATALNKPIGEWVFVQWLGFSPWFALVPTMLLAVLGLAKANYLYVQQLEKERDRAIQEKEEFEKQIDGKTRLMADAKALGEEIWEFAEKDKLTDKERRGQYVERFQSRALKLLHDADKYGRAAEDYYRPQFESPADVSEIRSVAKMLFRIGDGDTLEPPPTYTFGT